jgi:hypothetical protein
LSVRLKKKKKKTIGTELLDYLSSAPSELRADVAEKVCVIAEKYGGSNKRWQVDTILRVMSTAASLVPEETLSNLVAFVAANPELHAYATSKMYVAIQNDISQVKNFFATFFFFVFCILKLMRSMV